MADNLTENATHLTKFNGRLERRTDSPTDSDVAGLKVGQIWNRTDTNHIAIQTTTSSVRSIGLTTTSTSTS